MIRVVVKPARRRLAGRKQWRFTIVAANGKLIDPRDSYANVGDIRDVVTKLLASDEPVVLEVHYTDRTHRERLR